MDNRHVYYTQRFNDIFRLTAVVVLICIISIVNFSTASPMPMRKMKVKRQKKNRISPDGSRLM